jgi:hypothetical protein
MPTPEGVINTSQLWSGNADSNQVIEETAQDITTSEEEIISESEVVESGSAPEE